MPDPGWSRNDRADRALVVRRRAIAIVLTLATAGVSLFLILLLRDARIIDAIGATGIPERLAPLGGNISLRIRTSYDAPLMGPAASTGGSPWGAEWMAGGAIRIVGLWSFSLIVVAATALAWIGPRRDVNAPPRLARAWRRRRLFGLAWCSAVCWMGGLVLFFAGWVVISQMERTHRSINIFTQSGPYLTKSINDGPTSIALMLLGHAILTGMVAGIIVGLWMDRTARRTQVRTGSCRGCGFRMPRGKRGEPCTECGLSPIPPSSQNVWARGTDGVRAASIRSMPGRLGARLGSNIPLWKLVLLPVWIVAWMWRRWRVWTPVLAVVLATAPISIMVILDRTEVLRSLVIHNFFEEFYRRGDDAIYRILGYYPVSAPVAPSTSTP